MQRTALLMTALWLLLAGPALAQGITIERPWARATAPNAEVGGAFVTVTGTTADRLLSAASPVAGHVALHRTVDDNGVMKMLPVETLPVGPGAPIEMKPGGLHIMLMQLKAPLQLGATFPLTLIFEKAGPVTTQVMVEAAGASGPTMHAHPAPKP